MSGTSPVVKKRRTSGASASTAAAPIEIESVAQLHSVEPRSLVSVKGILVQLPEVVVGFLDMADWTECPGDHRVYPGKQRSRGLLTCAGQREVLRGILESLGGREAGPRTRRSRVCGRTSVSSLFTSCRTREFFRNLTALFSSEPAAGGLR